LVQEGKCKILNIDWDQNIKTSFESSIRPGTTIDISQCSYKRTFTRVKETNKYLLDSEWSIQCGGKNLIDTVVLLSFDLDEEDGTPERVARVFAQSDVYAFRRGLSFGWKKFTESNGYVSFGVQRHNIIDFSNRLSYVRTVQPETGKLATGEYVLTTSTGVANQKVCTMKVDNTGDIYYNALTCSINRGRAATVEYGWALEANTAQLLAGRRAGELVLNIPGRSAKFVLDGHIYSALNQHDDDEDSNNARELNGTLTWFWDHVNEPSKKLVLTLKRDNYALGKSKTTADLDVFGGPTLKSINFAVTRDRSVKNTRLGATLGYSLVNGKSNQIEWTADLHSNHRVSSFAIEEELQRPSYNVRYASSLNKWNGKLLSADLRAGKVISLKVTKDELDITKRRISFELQAPCDKHSVARTETFSEGVYTVVTTLSNEAGTVLSEMTSVFNANYNRMTVDLDGKALGTNYQLDVGVDSEKRAHAKVTKNNGAEELALIEVKFAGDETVPLLVAKLQWNRVWSQVKQAALGETDSALAESSDYNTYFGDVYSVLRNDLKDTYWNVRGMLNDKRQTYRAFAHELLTFYAAASPYTQHKLQQFETRYVAMLAERETYVESTPFHVRAFRLYNKYAAKLNNCYTQAKQNNKSYAKYIPRVPLMAYNEAPTNPAFVNTLVIERPTLKSQNLYQFYAEERKAIRMLGQSVLTVKGDFLLRSLTTLRPKSIINKFHYRPLRTFSLVGTVFKRRNVIAFNGESTLLKAKCSYLLTHELRRNEFSVVLNPADSDSVLTVGAGGKLVELSYTSAKVDGQSVALPYRASISDERELTITRNAQGVCTQVDSDARICTDSEAQACHIGVTRWYKGKLNGLLGQSQHKNEHFEDQSYWFADSTCQASSATMKSPSDAARETCYRLFADDPRAVFGVTFSSIRPQGWREACERAVTNSAEAKCQLIKAFVGAARLRRVSVSVPNDECADKCTLPDQSADKKRVNERLTSAEASGRNPEQFDIVYVVLPCPKENSLASFLTALAKKAEWQGPLIRTSLVYAGKDEASIYQSASQTEGAFSPVTPESFNHLDSLFSSTEEVTEKSFYGALFRAAELLRTAGGNRHIQIVSCGNCLPYSSLMAWKIGKILNKLNIVVHAFGDYTIRDSFDLSDDSFSTVFYTKKQAFVKYEGESGVEVDDVAGYRFQHSADMCTRLAQKTDGSIADIKLAVEPDTLMSVYSQLKWDEKPRGVARYCKRYETPFGDLVDMRYYQ